MSNPLQIIPAILATTPEDYKTKVDKINSSQVFEDKWVQIDLMDGKFVQNTSIGPEAVKKYKIYSNIEAHLMVEDPDFWVKSLKDAAVKRFIAPIEADKDKLNEFISFARAYTDCQIGFGLNPDTSLEKLTQYLEVAEAVLVMSVYPGFGGQEFITSSLERIKQVARLRRENGLNFLIGVDGGISLDNIKSVVTAGADYLVVGSHLLYGDIKQNLEEIWQILKSGD